MPISISAVLERQPLTEPEIKNGCALRLARCVRSAEGEFSEGPRSYHWDILCFSKQGASHSENLRCLSLRGNRRYLPSGARFIKPVKLAEHNHAIASDLWSAGEYSVLASADERRLVLTFGKSRLTIGRSMQEAAIEEYGQIIANASVDEDYPAWLNGQRTALAAEPTPSDGPLMSIVTPAYKTPPVFLKKMLDSVLNQTYGNWELIVVNASPDDDKMRQVFQTYGDPRIKVIETPENLGITGNTNLGLKQCVGDYVSFYDHDDIVEPYALARMVARINDSELRPGMLYCDEDNIDEDDRPSLPLFKPDYNEDFLLSNNYIIHWLTVRRDLLLKVSPSGKDVEGAQDYDMSFKIAELGQPVVHIPEVLYHWRIHSGSTAGNPAQKSYAQDAGAKAIQNHLDRIDIDGSVERRRAFFTYRAKFDIPTPLPAIQVFCESGEPSEITSSSLNAYNKQVRTTEKPSAIHLALFISPVHDLALDDLTTLVSHAMRDNMFSVSPRVVRQDGLFDYANSVVAPNGTVLKLLTLLPEQDGGYVGRSERPMDAVVGNPECCLVRLDIAEKLGLDSEKLSSNGLLDAFAIAWARGKKNLYMPYATACLNSPKSLLREEPRALSPKVADELLGSGFRDPSFNPSFDQSGAYYKLHK